MLLRIPGTAALGTQALKPPLPGSPPWLPPPSGPGDVCVQGLARECPGTEGLAGVFAGQARESLSTIKRRLGFLPGREPLREVQVELGALSRALGLGPSLSRELTTDPIPLTHRISWQSARRVTGPAELPRLPRPGLLAQRGQCPPGGQGVLPEGACTLLRHQWPGPAQGRGHAGCLGCTSGWQAAVGP